MPWEAVLFILKEPPMENAKSQPETTTSCSGADGWVLDAAQQFSELCPMHGLSFEWLFNLFDTHKRD